MFLTSISSFLQNSDICSKQKIPNAHVQLSNSQQELLKDPLNLIHADSKESSFERAFKKNLKTRKLQSAQTTSEKKIKPLNPIVANATVFSKSSSEGGFEQAFKKNIKNKGLYPTSSKEGAFERALKRDESNSQSIFPQRLGRLALTLFLMELLNNSDRLEIKQFQYPETLDYTDIPEEYDNNEVFTQFIDPITGELIRFPVSVENQSGNTAIFDRKSLIGWLKFQENKRQPFTHPINRDPIQPENIREDLATRKIIEDEMIRLGLLTKEK